MHTHIHVHVLTRTFTLSCFLPFNTHAHTHIHSFVHIHYYFSVFMSLFISLSIFLTNSNISTCPLAPGKMCCQCFSSRCHSRHAPKWPPRLQSLFLSLSSFHSPFQSQTHTYIPVAVYVPQKPTFNDSQSFLFPCIALSVMVGGGTANDNYVRLKGSVLRCNLTVAFLGSPLSVSPLLPWLPVKSLLCLFVAKFFFFLP